MIDASDLVLLQSGSVGVVHLQVPGPYISFIDAEDKLICEVSSSFPGMTRCLLFVFFSSHYLLQKFPPICFRFCCV